GPRVFAARESCRCAGHCRAAQGCAAQRLVASAPQRRRGGAFVNAPQRRGACPGLSAPMLTGDGLLVRLNLADSIALDAFRDICAAARRHGNGIMEVTTRGSLQVRGLTARSADAFADAVTALNIVAAADVRVMVDPLADDPS